MIFKIASNIIIFIILLFGICNISIAQDKNEKIQSISLGLSIYDEIDKKSIIEVKEKMLKNIIGYYKLNANIIILDNYRQLIDNIDNQAEVFVKKLIKNNKLDYLIYIRNRRNLDLWFDVWNKRGQIENIIIPYSSELVKFLPDIATNSFLSIIESMDNKLYNNKQY